MVTCKMLNRAPCLRLHFGNESKKLKLTKEMNQCKGNKKWPIVRVVTRYMRSWITAPGSGITTLGIGISSVFVESGIKIVNGFGIRDQNSQCFCDQGLKFSTFL